MKYLFLSAIILAACSRKPSEIQQHVDQLERVESITTQHIVELRSEELDIQSKIDKLNIEKQSLDAAKDNKKVRYILTLSIRQIHYNILNVKKQIADAVNEEKFEMYTDKEHYQNVSPGQDLFDSFRVGSVIMKGSLGSWRIKVEGKHTVIEE